MSRVLGLAVGTAVRKVEASTLPTRVLGGCAVVALVIFIVGIAVHGQRAEEAKKREQAALAEKAESDRREKEAFAAEKEKQDAARVKAVLAETSAKSKAMDRANRDAWIRRCVNEHCSQTVLDTITGAAPTEGEQDRAVRVAEAEESRLVARTKGEDGTTVSAAPVATIIRYVAEQNSGIALLELLPKTSVAEAMKDSASARGSVLRVSGTVVEIRTEGGFTEGALSTGDFHFVRFVTGSSTKGIYAQSWATFAGVYVQEYAYANVSGGQTRSLLVAGAFDIPDNHTARNGPEPPASRTAAGGPGR